MYAEPRASGAMAVSEDDDNTSNFPRIYRYGGGVLICVFSSAVIL
jgi:hypothetical protein